MLKPLPLRRLLRVLLLTNRLCQYRLVFFISILKQQKLFEEEKDSISVHIFQIFLNHEIR